MHPGKWLVLPRCFGCGLALSGGVAFCYPCTRFFLREPPHPEALFIHEGPGRGFVQALRGEAPQRMSAWALALLGRAGRMEQWRALGVELVVHAPQNRRRKPSGLALLAEAIAQELGVPYLAHAFRKNQNRTQHGKSLVARMDTECFIDWNGPLGAAERKNVLVIDDVLTTGTTLDLCAYVLRREGAKHVRRFFLAYQVVPGLEREHEEPDEEGKEVHPLLL